MRKIILTVLTLIVLLGCGHVVPLEVRESVDKDITAPALFKDPDAYKGRVVMLGGIIASSKNMDEGTYLEVVEKELDAGGNPMATDISNGRFLILYSGYLDTAIYSKGREVTVVGEVMGKKLRPLGEMQYPYPLIKSRKLYLFEKRELYNMPFRFGIGIFHTF